MGGRGAKSSVATSAISIENMNEAQLRREISRNTSQINKISKELEKYNVRDEYNGQFPLGVGFRSDKQYVRNIEKAVRNAKEYTDLAKQLENLNTKNNRYKNALNSIKGTGKTQSQIKQETVNKIASSSTTKWSKSKISGGTSYSSGEYRINNVEGTSFIYRNNERIGMADSLKKAKAYVDIYKKRNR